MTSLLATLLLGLTACAQNTNQSANPMVAHEIRLLEFTGGGSPLTPAEQQQSAAIVAQGMRSAPDAWRKADADMQKAIAILDQNNAARNNALRELFRYAYVFPSATNSSGPLHAEFLLEQHIVAAHDPVLAVDPARKLVITEHMLGPLQQTAGWIAKSYQLAPPGPSFLAIVRREIRALPTLDAPIAQGLAHIESNAWYAPVYFDHIPEPRRTNFFTNSRKTTFNNLADPTSEQWQIAEAAGMLASYAQKQAPQQQQGGNNSAQLSERLLTQQMQMKALQGAARSYSPSCNVTVGSYGSRAAAGCYP